MKQKSMKINAILTVFKTLLSLIVPLITFPYISRVLQVEAIGKYNFSTSIISYFILLAGLGIGTYAIREGSKVRNDRLKISKFSSEMLYINGISTIVSYVFLAIIIIIIPKIQSYSVLLVILSTQMLFSVYGRVWIYNIFEEFGFVTFVQVGFQILSIVLLFIFVKAPDDLCAYAVINVISATGSNILYGIEAKKYIDFIPVKLVDLKRHIKPVMIIFGTSIATTIYVNSDMTILGWMVDDRCVGLYSTAVKIYNIIKQVMVAVITVTIPRLTLYADTDKFKSLFIKVFNMLLMMTLPAMTGLLFLSGNAIEIIASQEYLPAATSLQWLSIAFVCALLACLFGTSVLLPYNKEKIFLKSTVISAIVNVVLNFILIPVFQQDAAAFTTALSQAVALIMCYHYSKVYVELKNAKKPLFCTIVGCIGIAFVCIVIKNMDLGLYMETVSSIVASVVIYVMIQFGLKNEVFVYTLKISLNWIGKKIKRQIK